LDERQPVFLITGIDASASIPVSADLEQTFASEPWNGVALTAAVDGTRIEASGASPDHAVRCHHQRRRTRRTTPGSNELEPLRPAPAVPPRLGSALFVTAAVSHVVG
jgi:hypothetical protein